MTKSLEERMANPSKHADLVIDGKKVSELPLIEGSMGHRPCLGISHLGNDGFYTYDPGFVSTAACSSDITYIDGMNGELLYRGYPIEELAEKFSYLDVCYLLLHGDLPDQSKSAEIANTVTRHTLVHEQMCKFFNGFMRNSHPMAIMVGAIGALSAFYHDHLDIQDPNYREAAAMRLIAKMPTLAAMCYKYAKGQPFIYPDNSMSYTENFLHMMFGVPCEDVRPNPVFVKALDKILILHADHEQNASTTTVRVAGSTGANPFVCISAGIGALWGPAHGGANEACLKMLDEIGDEKHIDEFIKRAKDPDDSFRLMGFGHRVYKNYDPRAKIMRDICHEVLEAAGRKDDPLFKLAMKLEKIALEDEYFVKRKLYPNVDFYSGITLSAIGIPSNLFTVIFAVARTAGWIAHWMEMVSSPVHRISRPRQLYTGHNKRHVKG